MPKAANSDMPAPVQGESRPLPPSREIKRFDSPSGPKVDPMSPGAPKQADKLKTSDTKDSGSIDPRQQHY